MRYNLNLLFPCSHEVDDGPRGRGAQSEHQPGPHTATVRGRATEEPQQAGLGATRDAHGQEAGGKYFII